MEEFRIGLMNNYDKYNNTAYNVIMSSNVDKVDSCRIFDCHKLFLSK